MKNRIDAILFDMGGTLRRTARRTRAEKYQVRALDQDGNELPWLRRDEIAHAGVHLRLPLHRSDGGLNPSATFGYEWTRSNSTDLRYTYLAHRVVLTAALAR